MSSFITYLKRVKSIPIPLLLKKVRRKAKRTSFLGLLRVRDTFIDSRRIQCKSQHIMGLPICYNDLNFEDINVTRARKYWHLYRQHYFNLLGSGWIHCGFINNSNGFEGFCYDALILDTDENGCFLDKLLMRRHIPFSKHIWQQITSGYKGIDWQKDFKSGYRWSQKYWYTPLKLADQPGGDIKLPWELGRLQHLPRLAIFYHLLPAERSQIFHEYTNQLLDFMAQNPVRWGVQSMCPMDMGIRVANITLAHSLFLSQGVCFPSKIDALIANYIYATCRHIYYNLEWSDEFTNNHYLADLAGLLYGSCFLAETQEVKKWRNFSSSELEKEFDKQFNKEGSNREGSSFYHRLSSEIIAWSFALMLRMKLVNKIDEERLFGSLLFLQALIRPDGLMTAIGDNDSGIFFHLSFTGKGNIEEPNNVSATISAISAFFIDAVPHPGFKLEYSLVKALLGSISYFPVQSFSPAVAFEKIAINHLFYTKNYTIFSGGINLTQNMEITAFPQFGVFIFRSRSVYLCFNLSENGQNNIGGHGHNDKLSFELFIDGKIKFEDPGTYVYTASQIQRDAYRSVIAHNTIYAGVEQNDFITTFSITPETKCRIGVLSKEQIVAEVRYKDVIHVRKILFKEDKIEVWDYCNKEFIYPAEKLNPCRGYGNKEAAFDS